MKVKGLDGKTYNWKLNGRMPSLDDDRKRSALHLSVRALLREIFPHDRILEEVPLPGSGKLTADFYLPARDLMVEAHGEQHYRFTARFHKNFMDFIVGKKRDRNKADWARLNNLTLVELPYNENEQQWRDRIEGGN